MSKIYFIDNNWPHVVYTCEPDQWQAASYGLGREGGHASQVSEDRARALMSTEGFHSKPAPVPEHWLLSNDELGYL